jgi:hypothetical protein
MRCMVTDYDFMGEKIITLVTTMIIRVSQNDTHGGTVLRFVHGSIEQKRISAL